MEFMVVALLRLLVGNMILTLLKRQKNIMGKYGQNVGLKKNKKVQIIWTNLKRGNNYEEICF